MKTDYYELFIYIYDIKGEQVFSISFNTHKHPPRFILRSLDDAYEWCGLWVSKIFYGFGRDENLTADIYLLGPRDKLPRGKSEWVRVPLCV